MIHEFNAAGVEYLVVGAYALAGYGLARATRDLDLWIRVSPENARRVLAALAAFGAPQNVAAQADLLNPELVVQICVEPLRVDILMAITGVDFDAAYSVRSTVVVGDVSMPLLSREHLIANKRAAARPKDLIDVAWLEQHPD
ncbi:MAG: hypothetical protein K2X99_07380 [Gemmatimonadaceae bacterium]|nr:hypothetical protein [Gemmatimonadaceae bacterium]